MKKRVIFIVLTFFLTLNLLADPPQGRFNPQQFQANMEAFITKEANLSIQESAKFFPLYREMQTKQRALYQKGSKYKRIRPATDAECKKALQEMDEIDIQIKKLQQQYNIKFMKVLPARKVYDVRKAEEKFHRQAVSRFSRRHAGQRNRNRN